MPYRPLIAALLTLPLTVLLATILTGCGIGGPSRTIQVLDQELTPERDGDVTATTVDEAAASARVGDVGGAQTQVILYFRSSIALSFETDVSRATLSIFVEDAIGDPHGNLGGLVVERAELADAGTYSPFQETPAITTDEFNAAGSAGFAVTDVVATPAGRIVSVDVTDAFADNLIDHDLGFIGFRIRFPTTGAGGPDAYVALSTMEASSNPAPTLRLEGTYVVVGPQ